MEQTSLFPFVPKLPDYLIPSLSDSIRDRAPIAKILQSDIYSRDIAMVDIEMIL